MASISWLSNDVFLVAHTLSSVDSGILPATTLHVVTRQTQPQPSFIVQKLPDPCPSFGTNRLPPYTFLLRLKEFPPNLIDLIIVISTAAPDVGLISRSNVALTNDLPADRVTNTFTTTTTANDARRASIPLSANLGETSAIGVGLDLSSKETVKRPLPGEEIEDSPGPLPALLVLNHEGILCLWWLVYTESIRQGTSYSGLAPANLHEQKQFQAPQQGLPAPNAGSSINPAFGQSSFSGILPSTHHIGNTLNKPVAILGTFGVASGLGKQQSPWVGNTSTNMAAQSSNTAFGQAAFGAPSMNTGSQGVTFGTTGGLGNRTSPWTTPSSGSTGDPKTVLSQSGGLGMQNGTFFGASGSKTSAAPFSGGFAAFAKAPGFAAAAVQGGAERGFATAIVGGSFGSGMDTDTSFGATTLPKEASSTPFKTSGFTLGSTFKGDGTAVNDLPSGRQDESNPFSIGSFDAALADTRKGTSTPPIKEAEMDDSSDEDGKSSQGSPINRESTTPAAKPPGTIARFPTTAPPSNGGFFGTQAQSKTTPASVQLNAPTTSTFGKPTPFTNTPIESPRKPEDDPRSRIETTLTPLIKREPDDDENTALLETPKSASEPPLPPESTSKATYTAGDTSNSSKASLDEAPLPPDFLPAKSKAKVFEESPQDTPVLPAVHDDEGLEDDEGSGVDVAQDISPPTEPSQSPRITPGSSFGASFDKIPADGIFTKNPRQQPRQNSKSLFGEVLHPSAPFIPIPTKVQESPRSPSPVRPFLKGDGLRPDNARSVSAPGRPSKTIANRKIVPHPATDESFSLPSLENQRKQERDRLIAQKVQKFAEEEQDLSDREDEKVREELATEVEAKKTLDPFLAHQDYIGDVSKPGIPGQIEALYRDINSMIDTLGLNARCLKAFTKGHSELYREGGRSREDLENDDWCLIEIANLEEVESQLFEQLEDGCMTDVRGRLEECRELCKELRKIRSNRFEITKVVDAKSDPEQIKARKAAPLQPIQLRKQNDLRKDFAHFQKLLADAEEGISVLRAKLASQQTSNSKSAPLKKPTVEAVTSTIKKMTSMVEKKSLDIDILETQMRKLRFSAVDSSNSEESSPFGASLPSSTKKPLSFRKSGSMAQGESFHSLGVSRSTFGGSITENGTPRKRMSTVTDDEIRSYRLKVQRRGDINEMVKKVFLNSGPRIVSLD